MSYKYIVNALDSLIEYPDLIEYIKTFDSPRGFMFTVETDINRKEFENRLSNLLDARGMHSGSSWAFMLRGVQSVLNGVNTREYFVEKMIEEERYYEEYMIELKAKWAKAEQAKQEQAKQEQAKQEQAKQEQTKQEQAKQDEEHAKMLAEFENNVEKAKKEQLILDEAEYKLKSTAN